MNQSTTIVELFQNYIDQRDRKEIIEFARYRKEFQQLGFGNDTIEKLIMILENEWDAIDHLKAKINVSKSHIVMGLVMSISAGIFTSWVLQSETIDTNWKVILVVGTTSSFIYGLKSIKDIRLWKNALIQRKLDWQVFQRINEDLTGLKIQSIEANPGLQLIVINTNHGAFQFIAPGIIIPMVNDTLETEDIGINAEGLEITRTVYEGNCTKFELSDGSCLLHIFSFLNEIGQPVWELIHLDREKYNEHKNLDTPRSL